MQEIPSLCGLFLASHKRCSSEDLYPHAIHEGKLKQLLVAKCVYKPNIAQLPSSFVF